VLNGDNAPVSFNLGWKGKYVLYKLAQTAVTTFHWGAHQGFALATAWQAGL
jgi:hypothetical protein